MKTIQTSLLEIGYEVSGPANGTPVLLLHGWPDAPRGWHGVSELLQKSGFRTITPYLRGFLPTRFLSAETIRDGTYLALTQDAIDLADALNLDRFAVVGHDWGARTAYTLAALFPEHLLAAVALSGGHQTGGAFKIPGLELSRRYWYQWFQCIEGGADAVRRDPVAFARIQWETWSPPGWYSEEEFGATAQSFNHPDWAAITLNSYRSRWMPEEKTDPRYAPLKERLAQSKTLSAPTLLIHGTADYCIPADQTENQKCHFSGNYRRVLLEGIGHFPHREAPEAVAQHIVSFFSEVL